MPKPDWTDEPKMIGGVPVPSMKDIEEDKINSDLERQQADDAPTRAAAAVALRVAGASYTSIAKTLDYSSAFRARQVVERALAEAAESDDSYAQVRHLESRRLERLLQGVWRRATNETDPRQMEAARVALAIIDRHARLHGLDAPQQMVVYTPEQQEVDRWVKAMAAQVRGQTAPAEAEVIEVEWEDVPDGEPKS